MLWLTCVVVRELVFITRKNLEEEKQGNPKEEKLEEENLEEENLEEIKFITL